MTLKWHLRPLLGWYALRRGASIVRGRDPGAVIDTRAAHGDNPNTCAGSNARQELRLDGKGLPKTADVVVIGAGVVGCLVAYYLAREGVNVTLVER